MSHALFPTGIPSSPLFRTAMLSGPLFRTAILASGLATRLYPLAQTKPRRLREFRLRFDREATKAVVQA